MKEREEVGIWLETPLSQSALNLIRYRKLCARSRSAAMAQWAGVTPVNLTGQTKSQRIVEALDARIVKLERASQRSSATTRGPSSGERGDASYHGAPLSGTFCFDTIATAFSP